jgi:hypothetical protein
MRGGAADEIPAHVRGYAVAKLACAQRCIDRDGTPWCGRQQPHTALDRLLVSLDLRFERQLIGHAEAVGGIRQIFAGLVGPLVIPQIGAEAGAHNPFGPARGQHPGIG